MWRSASTLLLILALGCAEPPEPNWLFQGQWIDVDSRGRTADETCKGTFDYLDRYAEAVSAEFGVDEHLGVYHWYSEARYDAEQPCDRPVVACAESQDAFSATIPVDHELVHMASNIVGAPCPSVLEEGLATYYSWAGGQTPSKKDFELLAERFDAPDEKVPGPEYDVAGYFVGFLVRQFGLDAVFEVCRQTGARPDSKTFEAAMISVLGASPDELLAELAEYELQCDQSWWYRSRLFTCGPANVARHAGVVDDELLLEYRMGCGEETTVGPIRDTIWIVEQVQFLHSGPHSFAMFDADGKAPPVEIELAPCDPCGYVHTFNADDAFGPLEIQAGTYWLEMRANAEFSGEFTLQFSSDAYPPCTPLPNEPCEETSDD